MSEKLRIIVDKRQVTLPRAVCDELGLTPGDSIEIEIEDGRVILRPGRAAALYALDELRRVIAESGVTEKGLLKSGRALRKEVFRETYPDLAHKHGV